MKIGLIFTLVYGRINYRLDYFCFLAGVIFSLIVNFMFFGFHFHNPPFS